MEGSKYFPVLTRVFSETDKSKMMYEYEYDLVQHTYWSKSSQSNFSIILLHSVVVSTSITCYYALVSFAVLWWSLEESVTSSVPVRADTHY